MKILRKRGFFLDRVRGSHHILVNPEKRKTISVPVHKGRTLGRGITLSIIEEAGLSPDEFLKLLH